MKTVAVIACSDTKLPEITFVLQLMEKFGMRGLPLDPSTSPGYASPFTISRERIVAEIGLSWRDLEGKLKHELLEAVAEGCAAMTERLYSEGRIHAAFCMGGLQNTTVGARAMKRLPIGVPKLVVSTVASGRRPFELIVGSRDILVMPSVCDLAGMNAISENVLTNAVAALSGMVEKAGGKLTSAASVSVGATLMGATNDGVDKAAQLVRKAGPEVVAFHSTGVGGRVMEELIADGFITAAMDLTLHEIVYEYFGGGFGAGAENRLMSGAKKGIPMLVAPGGVDFICQWKHELFPDVDSRKLIWHNAQLAHVKLRPQETRDIAAIIVERLNKALGPVVVIIPNKGLRSFARPGEALYDPEADAAITKVFAEGLKKSIPIKNCDANLMDEAFSIAAAKEMLALLDQ